MSKDELQKEVSRQIEELTVAGKMHQFSIEKRCRVCRDNTTRNTVNKLLAYGTSFVDILEILAPVNEALPKERRISKSSLYTHSRRHFPLEDASAAVFRKIMEEETEKTGGDWIDGIGSQINYYTYLKTMETKGFQNLMAPGTEVTPVEGMNASQRYHELIKEEADAAQVAEAYQKLNVIINAVKANVKDPEILGSIIRSVEAAERGVLDVEEVPEVQAEFEEQDEQEA